MLKMVNCCFPRPCPNPCVWARYPRNRRLLPAIETAPATSVWRTCVRCYEPWAVTCPHLSCAGSWPISACSWTACTSWTTRNSWRRLRARHRQVCLLSCSQHLQCSVHACHFSTPPTLSPPPPTPSMISTPFSCARVLVELSVAELALRKRVRESAWFDHHHLDFRLPFAAADIHGHGRLSVPEFQDAVARLGVAMSPQELSNLARRLDTNADGTIDYYEFAKLIDLDPSELYVWSNFVYSRMRC